jgi:hypothetical protein
MNDMETEARRLLAAATRDVPQAIDLLGGFAGARRRDRARRTRGRAVLSAGVAAAAAAATALTLTVGSGVPALATVTSALSHTLTQSYHLIEVDGYYSSYRGRPFTEYAKNTCTTEADLARNLENSSCTDGLVWREVGRYTYISGNGGKNWAKHLTADIITPQSPGKAFMFTNGFLTAPPRQMLAQLEETAKVAVAGPVSGQGWTGTRYTFTATIGPGDTESGSIDVDHQGRVRALVLTQRPGQHFLWTQILTFSDFGAPVTVNPPPPDQVYTGP